MTRKWKDQIEYFLQLSTIISIFCYILSTVVPSRVEEKPDSNGLRGVGGCWEGGVHPALQADHKRVSLHSHLASMMRLTVGARVRVAHLIEQ